MYYHSENHATSQIWKILPNMVFSPDLGGKNGGVLSMCMQVILDSSFARPGSAPIWGGKKGEFRDWTKLRLIEEGLGFQRTIYHLGFHKVQPSKGFCKTAFDSLKFHLHLLFHYCPGF